MKKSIALSLTGVLVALAIIACGAGLAQNRGTPTPGCPPLPAGFKESDLIGTWLAKYDAAGRDTLILRGDGTYEQAYSDSLSGYHFESGWRGWWIERRASGYLGLHMEGMLRCDEIGSLCETRGGGTGDLAAIDYREGSGANMPDGLILIVTGVFKREALSTPRGMELLLPRLAGAEWTYSFKLQQ